MLINEKLRMLISGLKSLTKLLDAIFIYITQQLCSSYICSTCHSYFNWRFGCYWLPFIYSFGFFILVGAKYISRLKHSIQLSVFAVNVLARMFEIKASIWIWKEKQIVNVSIFVKNLNFQKCLHLNNGKYLF